MKRIITSVILILVAISSFGQETISPSDSMDVVLSNRIDAVVSSINELRQNHVNLSNKVEQANHEISLIKDNVTEVQNKTSMNEVALSDLDQSFSSKLTEASESYEKGQSDLSSSIRNKSLFGGILIGIIALLGIILFMILRKRIDSSQNAVESIRSAQKSLKEESIKLDNKLLELFDTQLKVQKEDAKSKKSDEIDHSLALKVADELTRIEINLSRMDSSIRGYKQLSASLRRIKDNFLANGYEIVDMLGKPYNDGMKVIANFVPDETLKEGEQIITGIVKPQINYKGEMIQAAQITVSQN